MNVEILVNINLSKNQWIRTIYYKNKNKNKNIKYYFKMLIFIYFIINKYIFILKISLF